jgi:thiamine biosynthesis lipoprotein ApbE
MVADILATALLVLGPERGREWLIQHRDVAALLLEVAGPTLRAYWSPAMSRYMRRLSAEKVNLQ